MKSTQSSELNKLKTVLKLNYMRLLIIADQRVFSLEAEKIPRSLETFDVAIL